MILQSIETAGISRNLVQTAEWAEKGQEPYLSTVDDSFNKFLAKAQSDFDKADNSEIQHEMNYEHHETASTEESSSPVKVLNVEKGEHKKSKDSSDESTVSTGKSDSKKVSGGISENGDNGPSIKSKSVLAKKSLKSEDDPFKETKKDVVETDELTNSIAADVLKLGSKTSGVLGDAAEITIHADGTVKVMTEEDGERIRRSESADVAVRASSEKTKKPEALRVKVLDLRTGNAAMNDSKTGNNAKRMTGDVDGDKESKNISKEALKSNEKYSIKNTREHTAVEKSGLSEDFNQSSSNNGTENDTLNRDVKFEVLSPRQSSDGNGDGRGDSGDRFSSALKSEGSQLTKTLQESGNGEIVKQAKFILKNNDSGEVRLTLRPESLGSVRIRLQMNDHVLTGKIIVDNQVAKEAFDQNLSDLKNQFRELGFSIEGFDVSLANDSGRERQETARGLISDAKMRKSAILELGNAVPNADTYYDSHDMVNVLV